MNILDKFKSNSNKLNNIYKRDSIITSSILPLFLSLICLFFNNKIMLSFQNLCIPFILNIILKLTFALLLALFAIIVYYSIKQFLFYNSINRAMTNKQLDSDKYNFAIFSFFVFITIMIIIVLWISVSIIVFVVYKLSFRVDFIFRIHWPWIILILFVICILIFLFIKPFKNNKLIKYLSDRFLFLCKYSVKLYFNEFLIYFVIYILFLFLAFLLIAFNNQKEFKIIFNEEGVINIESNINFKDTDKVLYEIRKDNGKQLSGTKKASESQIDNNDVYKYSMILFKNNNNFNTIDFKNDVNNIVGYIFDKNSDAEFFYNYINGVSLEIDLNNEINELNSIENQKLAIVMIVCINEHTSIIVNNFSYLNGKYIFANKEMNFNLFNYYFS